MTLCRLAIIGCGAVGVSILDHLRQRLVEQCQPCAAPLAISIIEPSADLARGLAYQDDWDGNLLNRSNATISPRADRWDLFHAWLVHKQAMGTLPARYRGAALGAGAYAPRSLFGLFLQERLSETWALLERQGHAIRQVRDRAEDIVREPGGYRIVLASGESVRCDWAILCTGNQPATCFKHLRGLPGYHGMPYPIVRLAESLRGARRIGVIGSRLSAVDTALGLSAAGVGERVFLLSRSGILPMVGAGDSGYALSPEIMAASEHCRRNGSGSVSLVRLIRLVLREMSRSAGHLVNRRDLSGPRGTDPVTRFLELVEEARTGSRGWQEALVPLNDHIAHFWNGLSAADRHRLRQGLYQRFIAYRVAIPLENGERIARLLRAGWLDSEWPLQDIQPADGGFDIRLDSRPGPPGHPGLPARTLRVDAVVNATGAAADLGESTLYRNLFHHGLARPHAHGGVDVMPADNRVINAAGQPLDGLYAIGNNTVGVFLLTSNLILNALHAQRVVDRVLAESAVIYERTARRSGHMESSS